MTPARADRLPDPRAHIDFLEHAVDRLSAEIEKRIVPFAHQRDLLITIPGMNRRVAEVLIAEIGVDMSPDD